MLVHGHGKWPTGFHHSTMLSQNRSKILKDIKEHLKQKMLSLVHPGNGRSTYFKFVGLRLSIGWCSSPTSCSCANPQCATRKKLSPSRWKWWACAKPSSWTSRWDSRNLSAFPANHHRRSQGKYGLWSRKKDHPLFHVSLHYENIIWYKKNIYIYTVIYSIISDVSCVQITLVHQPGKAA